MKNKLRKLFKFLFPLNDFTSCYACVTPKKCSKKTGCGSWNKTATT